VRSSTCVFLFYCGAGDKAIAGVHCAAVGINLPAPSQQYGAEEDDGAQCGAWLSWMHRLAGVHALGETSVHDGHGGRVSEPEGLARRCRRGRCDEDLWIWHLFVGAPGSLNDINVVNQSPLYLDGTAGRWPPREVPFSINETSRTLPYYLVDGIYPRYAFLVSPHPIPLTYEANTFNCLQEAIRKDVERLFGVLTKRFHVALHPGRCLCVKLLILT